MANPESPDVEHSTTVVGDGIQDVPNEHDRETVVLDVTPVTPRSLAQLLRDWEQGDAVVKGRALAGVVVRDPRQGARLFCVSLSVLRGRQEFQAFLRGIESDGDANSSDVFRQALRVELTTARRSKRTSKGRQDRPWFDDLVWALGRSDAEVTEKETRDSAWRYFVGR